ncbi:Rab3 GTPase-activating protein catalytic subunit-domain-containing protein [Chlamydoabsidia padenii]|nr:Rab3 GTPase-activating protein catalytic subunit-domain-containing protein [Chlamydoabsidia padenii]
MTSSRRPSLSYGEESFEFVAPTTVSYLERLVTSIEETLLSWEIKNHSPCMLSFKTNSLGTDSSDTSTGSVKYSKHQTIAAGNDTYKLTFYHHPQSTSNQQQQQQQLLLLENYYQFSTRFSHSLHRWSGMGRLLILAPVTFDQKQHGSAFTKNNSDQQQTQNNMLLSACAIAFKNISFTGIPVFIPVGHARHDHYVGYMLQDVGKDKTLEVRFNSALVSPPPPLDNLDQLFRHHLNIDRLDNGLPPFSPTENLDISKEIVFIYHYKNWYNKYWKQWDDKSTSGFGNSNLAMSGDDDNRSCCKTLSFGPYNDPLRTITLNAIFGPDTSKEHHHGLGSRNMDGSAADTWLLFTEFAPPSQQHTSLSALLSDTISSWYNDPSSNDGVLCSDRKTTKKESSSRQRNSASIMRNILHAMVQGGSTSQQQANPPVPANNAQMDSIMDTLFNTSHRTSINNIQKTNHIKLRDENNDLLVYAPWALGLRLKHDAAVPWKSLLWNLMVCELDLMQNMDKGGHSTSFMNFVRALWIKIVRHLRWHWENLIPIPDVDCYLYRPGQKPCDDMATLGIDLSFNILHQKLSMINCCIHQSIKDLPTDDPLLTSSTAGNPTIGTSTKTNHPSNVSVKKTLSIPVDAKGKRSSKLDEGDYLIDSMDSTGGNETVIHRSNRSIESKKEDQQESSYSCSFSTTSDTSLTSSSLHESFVGLDYSTSAESDLGQHRITLPRGTSDDWSTDIISKKSEKLLDHDAFEGRSHQHESLLLLKTNTPLWVPYTQCSGFMTEDMIQQQAETLEQMGTSKDATQQRAKLQSAQLSSDMQSFKAANPHAVLEDFVRWYSPKDWVEKRTNDDLHGCLSARMSEPGNIWQTLWKTSARIPASRQPSLFNLAQEGEKALKYLEHLAGHEVFTMLLPTMGLIMYDTLASHPAVKYIRPVASGLAQLGDELIRFPWDSLRNGTCGVEDIVSKVKHVESILCHAISLLQKLHKQCDLVERLLTDSQTQVEDKDERAVVHDLYKNQGMTMVTPTYKEYVSYLNINSPSIDNPLPQRQYVLVKTNEVRLLHMFSGHGQK